MVGSDGRVCRVCGTDCRFSVTGNCIISRRGSFALLVGPGAGLGVGAAALPAARADRGIASCPRLVAIGGEAIGGPWLGLSRLAGWGGGRLVSRCGR